MSFDEQGSPIVQGTHRPFRGQPGVWDEDPAQISPPPYRIARASLPVQEQRRRQQRSPQQGASRHYAGSSHAISAIDEGLDDRPVHTSARRYRNSTMTAEQQAAPVTRRQRRPLHGAVYIGLTLLCMLVGFIVFSALSPCGQH